MKTKLKHIASIQTGLFAKPTANGEVVYLQAKYFNESGELTSPLHPDLKADDVSEKHLLRHGDVLFAAKGIKNFATYYENKNLPAVASTSFFVIRINEDILNILLPEFLAWIINQPQTQQQLKGLATGTAIPSISKPILEDLEISIPEIKTQKAVLKISQLRHKELKLKMQIEALKEKQLQKQIINAIN